MLATTHRRGSGLGAAVAGMLLVAATYGMARFGVGLFAPLLVALRPDLIGVIGWAAAAQFTSYSLAAAVAARLVDRRPRAGLVLAGVTSTAGCLGVAVASDPVVFVVAVFIGGMGGGFASPALVPVIDAVVARRATATAQSVVNSGTAVGVIGAGVVASVAASVGPAWVFMALVCAVTAVAAWYPVRARTDLTASRHATTETPSGSVPGSWRLLVVPGAAAVVAGAGAALIWTFGPLLATGSGSVSPDRVGWLWIALGLGGMLGALTGVVVERLGRRGGWCLCAGVLALANAGLALSVVAGSSWVAYAAMALFGAAYMGLSGVLILWARRIWPNAAGAGTSVLFIALAVGQALGSAGFGIARDALSPGPLALLAAGFCVLGGLTALIRTR
ncbi:MFS transporter [Saccharothrix deserti]|uniref:MFS transporter n=1 Tax=Saccharothrix deserti TaxID=2593674 RepID=UPI00131AEC2E|nr:MFS transporter [Saccharothrix deserti]